MERADGIPLGRVRWTLSQQSPELLQDLFGVGHGFCDRKRSLVSAGEMLVDDAPALATADPDVGAAAAHLPARLEVHRPIEGGHGRVAEDLHAELSDAVAHPRRLPNV